MEVLHRVLETRLRPLIEVVLHGIRSGQNRQLDIRQQLHDRGMVGWGDPLARLLHALVSRHVAKIVEVHRHECELSGIVERLFVHIEPFAQGITAAVVPAQAARLRVRLGDCPTIVMSAVDGAEKTGFSPRFVNSASRGSSMICLVIDSIVSIYTP